MKRTIARLHEHVALAALAAIAVHGLSLLGDGWLKPGLMGIAVPFAMSYRPAFTAAGIVAGYLVAVVGPSFYLRRRIGASRWRKLHRLSPAIWVLAVVHTLGTGSDAGALWLRAVVLAPLAPIVYLFVVRLLRERPSSQATAGHAARRLPETSAGTLQSDTPSTGRSERGTLPPARAAPVPDGAQPRSARRALRMTARSTASWNSAPARGGR